MEFKLYPELNHLFAEGQGLATLNEYLLVHGRIADYVVSAIAAFINKH